MKRFWEVTNIIFDWFMNLLFTTILIGGGIWAIINIFF